MKNISYSNVSEMTHKFHNKYDFVTVFHEVVKLIIVKNNLPNKSIKRLNKICEYLDNYKQYCELDNDNKLSEKEQILINNLIDRGFSEYIFRTLIMLESNKVKLDVEFMFNEFFLIRKNFLGDNCVFYNIKCKRKYLILTKSKKSNGIGYRIRWCTVLYESDPRTNTTMKKKSYLKENCIVDDLKNIHGSGLHDFEFDLYVRYDPEIKEIKKKIKILGKIKKLLFGLSLYYYNL